ncbi:MAG: hypothetical protein Q8907_00055 [Bacteroidota bacterium]|nr:hypothetical protein [Bacteroidota bacterium]MDP4272654.1 hypothetical protein [Bacteroidota bacterium]
MIKEYKTRRAIERKPLVYNLPVVNFIIFFAILFFSAFSLFSGISLTKVILITILDLFSYIVLSQVTEKKMNAFSKKFYGDKVSIKINSFKPFR